MTSLLFVLTFSIVLVGVGWSVVGRLDRSGRLNAGERLGVSFATGCFAVYLGVYIIGPFRFDGPSMWGLTAVLCLLSLPGLRAMPWAAIGSAAGGEFSDLRHNKWPALLWLTLTVIGFSSLLQGMAPPNDYDSLMYHLSFPLYDLENGRLGVPWDRGLPHALFPELARHLSRLALATMDAGVAQMLHGMLAIIAALGSAMVVLRLGYGKSAALGAAILFLSIRAVIWQMGSVEVDVPLGAFMILALICYLALRDNDDIGGNIGLAVLFGLMIGGGILVKYHGLLVALAFAPLIGYDLLRRRVSLTTSLVGPLVALGVILPHLVRDFLITGNPVFPLFNDIFNPGKALFFQGVAGAYGTGRGLLDLLSAPWSMFVLPMHYFDGMVYGAPYLLAFAPLVLLDRSRISRWGPGLSILAVYYVGWFYLVGQQVRFFAPAWPLLAAQAAAGVATLWAALEHRRGLKAVFMAVVLVLAVNQSLFIGIYGIIRLPVALGLMDPATYYKKTPTMNGAFYETCGYIKDNLKPGELYYSNLPHFFYCPQAPTVHIYFSDEAKWWIETATPPPEPSIADFIRRAEQAPLRYFLVSTTGYNRGGSKTAKPVLKKIDLSGTRHGRYLQPVFDTLTPLFQGTYTAVFDGPQVIAGLKQLRDAQ